MEETKVKTETKLTLIEDGVASEAVTHMDSDLHEEDMIR